MNISSIGTGLTRGAKMGRSCATTENRSLDRSCDRSFITWCESEPLIISISLEVCISFINLERKISMHSSFHDEVGLTAVLLANLFLWAFTGQKHGRIFYLERSLPLHSCTQNFKSFGYVHNDMSSKDDIEASNGNKDNAANHDDSRSHLNARHLYAIPQSLV
jgi:hypothetical protein